MSGLSSVYRYEFEPSFIPANIELSSIGSVAERSIMVTDGVCSLSAPVFLACHKACPPLLMCFVAQPS